MKLSNPGETQTIVLLKSWGWNKNQEKGNSSCRWTILESINILM